MNKCVESREIVRCGENVEFGVTDNKGRALGARVITREVEMVELLPDQQSCYLSLEPGRWFTLQVHQTRNGSDFGAGHRARYFRTAAERDAAQVKYLIDAKRRVARISRLIEANAKNVSK
jgi:hypothetical protein